MIMYFCAKSSDFASLYIFTIELLNYSDWGIFLFTLFIIENLLLFKINLRQWIK